MSAQTSTADDVREDIAATILRTLHQTDAGFRIVRARREDNGRELVMLGLLPDTVAGERLKVSGVWESSQKFGPRFRVESAHVEQPTTEEGLVECLSRLVDGVGPGLARKYVALLGGVGGMLEWLADNAGPLRVDEVMCVRGAPVTDATAARLYELRNAWQARAAQNAVELGLASLGLTPSLRNKVRAKYGAEAVTVCRTRPYELAFEVDGFGFKRADEVARSAGIDIESPERKEAALLHALREDAGHGGHIFCTKAQAQAAMQKHCEMLITEDDVDAATVALVKRGSAIAGVGGSIGLRYLVEAEREIAEIFNSRLRYETSIVLGPSVYEAEKASGLSLTDEQRLALSTVRFCNLAIITGGPGVGKSTTTRAVCSLFDLAGLRFKLAAPTGRAARRLAEATGREATTIHRMLSYDPQNGGFLFDRSELLPIDALLLDEASMIDVELLRSVLVALPPGCRLVFVGDADQLPPVGPGAPFRDLVASGALPTTRLETVHRQAAGSRIIGASREILDGKAPEASPSGDRSDGALFVAEVVKAEELAAVVVDLAAGGLAESFSWCKPSDVQIVSPQRKGPLGVEALNDAIQAAVNPRPMEERFIVKRTNDGGKARQLEFRIGDRVMQTKNDYQRGVVNGELGTVAEMLEHSEANRKAPVLSVRYLDGTEEKIVAYTRSDLYHLDLAYCTTVHKVQGAEFPAVIVVCHDLHRFMLERSLLYTALTRAKRLCVLVGTKKAIKGAAKMARSDLRRTTLGGLMEGSVAS